MISYQLKFLFLFLSFSFGNVKILTSWNSNQENPAVNSLMGHY